MTELKEVGIDTMIVQWCADTPNGIFKDTFYPELFEIAGKTEKGLHCPDFVEVLLKSAEKNEMKVFLGLNLSNEWWHGAAKEKEWRIVQAKLGREMAFRIHSLYKEKYKNSFHGWYFAWEYYNGMDPAEQAAEFLNSYLDMLTELDPTLPLLLSPFVRRNTTPNETKNEWIEIFKNTRFRKGDIFCCQDAVGAGHIDIEDMEEYFKALKLACDTVDGLRFWANNENFTIPGFVSAPLDRFVRQMNISRPYVETHITFSYSHYYSTRKGRTELHEQYKKYYQTGELN